MGERKSPRRNALEAAAAIADARALENAKMLEYWERRYPDDKLGAAVERACKYEAEMIAQRIRELMRPAPKAGGQP